MERLKRIIIVKDGEYTLGYRRRLVTRSFKLENKEKCFTDLIDFKKIRETDKKELITVYKTWNTKLSDIYVPYDFDNIKRAMDSLKTVKSKEDLSKAVTTYINDISSGAFKYYEKTTEKILRNARILKELYNENPDFINSIFIKYIVTSYYKEVLNNYNENPIDNLEAYKVSNYDDPKTMDNIMKLLKEDFSESNPSLYSFSKMVVNDEIDHRFDNEYNHVCGIVCKMADFRNCIKIYSDFGEYDISQFPFIKNGYQIEKNVNGKWIVDSLCVQACDYKHNTRLIPKKELELTHKKISSN